MLRMTLPSIFSDFSVLQSLFNLYFFVSFNNITDLDIVQVGSLTGAVASQRVTEAPKGTLRLDGNQSSSAIAEACLTVRQTSRTGTKVGNSDPAVPNGRAVAQRIKATLGITG